jgi:hypothetical protein
MILLVTFIAIALCGEALAVGLAFLVEDYADERAGVPTFFATSALVVWRGWKLALRLTAPAAEAQTSGG